MAKPGPARVVFGKPLMLTGDDYASLAKEVEDAVAGSAGTLRKRQQPVGEPTIFLARRLLAAGLCGTLVWEKRLSKDDLIDVQGTVVAVHSGGLYRVQCDAGQEVLAQLSGRMRRFRIKVVPGDRVTVGVSPYDPVRGIITFRAR